MSGDRNINFLLNLYEQQYVDGEIRSKETNKKNRNESKRKHRHLLLDELVLEAEQLHLNRNQIKIIRYLIDDFNEEFQKLHRKVSEKTIILAFMFYVKMIDDPRTRINAYKVSTNYKLTDKVFETIICRMLLKFMKKCPIRPYHNYSKDEHEILIREGKR